jgi:hypothetical protein
LAVTERLGIEESGGMMRVGTAYSNTLGEVERLLPVIDDLAWQENGHLVVTPLSWTFRSLWTSASHARDFEKVDAVSANILVEERSQLLHLLAMGDTPDTGG